MTPFLKMVRNLWERAVGKWEEGPEAPERLAAMVIAFANEHPHATRKEWTAFAQGMAAESYRSGYVRGYEWSERIQAAVRPDVPPEVAADLLDPDWKWTPMGSPELDLPDDVPEEGEELER